MGAAAGADSSDAVIPSASTAISSGERRLRIALAAVFYFGAAGTFIELLFLEHFEETVQFAPLAAILAGAVVLAAALWRPGPRTVAIARWTMLLLVLVAAIGVVLHFRSNVAFELEMEPDTRGARLVWLALHGATPSLAPGALAQLGLVGFLFTLGHPALRDPHAHLDRREP